MRRLSNGTILYGYDSVVSARAEVKGSPVWVAPNSLYRAVDIVGQGDGNRDSFVYVGRLVAAKKVRLLLTAFAESKLAGEGARLVFVGDGDQRTTLESDAHHLGVSASVKFRGILKSPSELSEIYARAVRSASPGYVGLSLTQSLGFGVPMIISRSEPHAPEIELQRFGGVTFFETDSTASLALALREAWSRRTLLKTEELSTAVRESYSAEAMAEGLIAALANHPQRLGDDGWPL